MALYHSQTLRHMIKKGYCIVMAANMEITDVLIYQLSIMTDPLLSLEQISEIWR